MTYKSLTQRLEQDVQNALHSRYPQATLEHVSVSLPTDKTKADLTTNVAFTLAKQLAQSPVAIAETLAGALNASNAPYHAEAAAPGFINFRLNDKALGEAVTNVLEYDEAFGANQELADQTWVIEHTSPNPNKAMHIGHLRNNLIGMSVANIVAFSGATVIRDSIDNNRGIAIARAMYGYLKFKKRGGEQDKDIVYWYDHQDEWLTPDDTKLKPDHFVGECYQLGVDAAKNSPEADQAIRQMVIDWEANEPKTWALWEKIIDYSHAGIEQTLERIGSRWDKVWHEHEHYETGRKYVQLGLEKGVFKELEGGAVLTNLEKYKLADTILLKSDGTSLYITQDIALTELKMSEFHPDKLLWVVGTEQSLALKQVFAVCEQLGIGTLDNFAHLPYGLVNILDESGARKKMSSRGGNTLFIDDLIDQVKTALLQTERGYADELAEKIAIAAIKYALLRPARTTDTVIDIQQAISLEGDSGLYLLYTLARMNTLLEKGGGDPEDWRAYSNATFNASEHDIIMTLFTFPQKVLDALAGYSPNTIVEPLLELSHQFNSYYAKERFITDDTTETQKKMAITKACKQVMINGLALLGIEPVERI